VITKDGICTLVDLVIVDPMHVDLFPRFHITQEFATSNAAQAKKRSYHNQHPIDQFFFLAIEVFGCLHKQADMFLHECANAIWSLKMLKALPFFFVLVTFFHQRFSITLQRMQTSSILSRAVAIGLVTSQLLPIQDIAPIATVDLLQIVSC